MDPLSPLVTSLHAEGRLRVWSLIITVFGDLVQPRGGRIATAALGQLLGRVGVEPGAMRTALSRLARDGWVTSERSGRASIYRLSQQGLDRFGPATSRIYAAPRADPVTRWAAAVSYDAQGNPVFGLYPEDQRPEDAAAVVSGTLDHLDDRFRDTLLSGAHRAALVALAGDLQGLRGAGLSVPLDAAAARMLLVHRWRRIVLRYAELAPQLMPGDAPLANPRLDVARAYATLSPLSDLWMDRELGPVPSGLQVTPRLAIARKA